jgi:hypothetical protein
MAGVQIFNWKPAFQLQGRTSKTEVRHRAKSRSLARQTDPGRPSPNESFLSPFTFYGSGLHHSSGPDILKKESIPGGTWNAENWERMDRKFPRWDVDAWECFTPMDQRMKGNHFKLFTLIFARSRSDSRKYTVAIAAAIPAYGAAKQRLAKVFLNGPGIVYHRRSSGGFHAIIQPAQNSVVCTGRARRSVLGQFIGAGSQSIQSGCTGQEPRMPE